MTSMKAVRIHSYGGHEVLVYEDVPLPVPAEGEVLIRVIASSVNPFDCAVRAGYMTAYFNYSLPVILGTDVSGIVEEVGPGVTDLMRGEAVYGRAGVYRNGSYAEYVVAHRTETARKPKTLDHIASAALPHVSLTAWQALFVLADLQKGQTVLIHGAGGGVGHIAVQLAKWKGARVIATASQNLGIVSGIGVDLAVDYSNTAFESVTGKVDVVLDTIGGNTQERSWAVLKPGGILVSTIQPPSEEAAAAHNARGAMVTTNPPIQEVLEKIAELVDGGWLKPHVSAVLPLREIQKAHGMVESRHTGGKLVLQVAE